MRRVENPPNPWHTQHREWLGPPPPARLEVYEELARSIVTPNESPDVGFRWSANPYRGCYFGCGYCYARPTHQYLDFGAGTDFERRIVAKVNAPRLLRRTFQKKSWAGEPLALSGNTDCYQPLEASYRLTRGMLEVCREFGNPVGIVTKSVLIQRDLDLLCELAAFGLVHVHFSIPFGDDLMARAIEPYAPSPSARFEAMRTVAAAGVPVSVLVAPIIPGLNESQISEILERAKACGATRASRILLRLPAEVKGVFLRRLKEAFPHRYKKVVHAIREMRGGALYRAEFGVRHRGSGQRWDAIEELFDLTCRRLGLNRDEEEPAPVPLRQEGAQLSLF
ncbi:MAG: PA0069 family radical SAM protein [Planctomycetota bacterium]|jgi:DNA repair photolyase